MIKSGILWIALFCCALANAQTFDFNANCRNAYNAIIALHLNEGKALIAAEEKKNPNNLIPVYLENYVDFLNLYTTDTRDLYNQLKSNKDLRIEMLSVGDRDSPYFLFCAAEMNLQWASVNIKFGDYLSAVFAIKKAYKFLVENEQRFPDFKPNKKTLGVLYALIGSVPDKYKWGVNMLGMEGNLSKGLNELKTLVEYGKQNDYIYQDETVIYYAFLLFHLQDDPDSAWRVLMDNGFPKKNNLMNLYACAHIGIYGKHNDEALKMLDARPNDSTLAAFPFLTYLYALGKLNKLEPDADSYFKKFIAEYKGENHLKSAYQKIAWGYLVKGDAINYKHFIGKVNKVGATTVDADKQAQREAETKAMPNINLLKARLLFDGGYYEKAAIQMKQLSEKSFTLTDDQTEYLYRLGRIYHAWNKPDTALMYYTKAIEKGKNLPRYFAANSAFESGELYEAKGDREKARYYYEMCLSFQDHEYKNGLDQKAKAGLNRIQ